MNTIRVVSTPTAGLRPLGSSGQRSHALLVDTLERALSPDHAALFAEPVTAPDGSTIDWYAQVAGDPQPLTALSGDVADAVRARLQTLTSDIVGLAERLSASDHADDRRRGEALRQALRHPDKSFIYVADGRPILTAWAYAHEDSARPVGNLSSWVGEPAVKATSQVPIAAVRPVRPWPTPDAAGDAPAEPMVAAALASPTRDRGRGFPWLQLLLWLVLIVLLALLTVQLVSACGVGVPGRALIERAGLVDRCPAGGVDRHGLAFELEREVALQAEIDRLIRDIIFADNACRQQALLSPGPGAPASPPLRPGGPVPPPAGVAPGSPPGGQGAVPGLPPEPQPTSPLPELTPPPGVTPIPAPALVPPELDTEREDFAARLDEDGAAGGNLTISLKWDDPSDLDLAVLCPDGQILSGANRQACGGVHELDANPADDPQARSRPVEHVYWPGEIASGAYTVVVTLYAYRDTPPDQPIAFQVRVAAGNTDEIVSGSVVGAGSRVDVLRMTVP